MATALVATSMAAAGISGTTGGDSFSGPGWDTPPATLGAWSMVQYDNFDPFVANGSQTLVATSDLLSTHTTTFSAERTHTYVGAGWSTWSGGYNGSVYYSLASSEASLALSPGTLGYSLFFETDTFGTFDFEVTAWDSDGNFVTVNTVTEGNSGATWAGFWTDGTTTITNLRVVGDGAFAVGRFGYAIPAPGAAVLAGLAGLIARRRRA